MAISALVLATSAGGLLLPGTYARETSNWASQARAQDITDVVVVGVLLAVALSSEAHTVRGFFVWAGGLLFLVYAFFIYAFSLHHNGLFLLYAATLGVLVYTFIGGALRADFQRLKDGSRMRTRTRTWLGAILILLAVAFYALWLGDEVPSLFSGTTPSDIVQAGVLVNPVHVLDIGLYLPAYVITGFSLIKDRAVGYAFAVPLLVFSVLTAFAILVIALL